MSALGRICIWKFQSSLLESCGTRGHAPYKAVLTHGFTMDQKGMKMSKSLGNTISPTDLMRDSGADILRLWALSVDFTEDHRIGKEILSGVSDQYRKLRNSFRYMLGALEGFSDAEKVAVADMPELERYVLHLLADMDAKLRQAVDDFDFNTYVRLLSEFANNDLSAFFFDIRKDSLYCDAATNPKRMAYRTVLDILFHALVRYAAPVLVFTAEEVWQTRFSEADSVHFLEWPEIDAGWAYFPNASVWRSILIPTRSVVSGMVEVQRREKLIGSSLEAVVNLYFPEDCGHSINLKQDYDWLREYDVAELFIVSELNIRPISEFSGEWNEGYDDKGAPFDIGEQGSIAGGATKTTHHKCGRCWRHLPEVSEDGTLCNRCAEVVNG
jgi:isoleucyl-tRNA synthetase